MTNERHEKLPSVQRVKNAYSKILPLIFNIIYVVGTQIDKRLLRAPKTYVQTNAYGQFSIF